MADFDQNTIDQVWSKASIAADNNSQLWRKDYAGAWIGKAYYGNRENPYGWEIDHLKPESKGGSNDLSNLLPLQWQNNLRKGDDYPEWSTEISSDGVKNIQKIQTWKIK